MDRRTLDDAWAKLGRAEDHFALLREQVESFGKASNHRIALHKDLDARRYTFKVHDLGEISESWPTVIGDCVHNARASLDYLMTRLVALATGEDPATINDIQFPIYFEVDGTEKSAVSRFRGDKSVTKLRESPALNGYLARIEELQPFNNGNPSIWGEVPLSHYSGMILVSSITTDDIPHTLRLGDLGNLSVVAYSHVPIGLERLSVLDNIDKHRSLHVPWRQLKSIGPGLRLGPARDRYQPFAKPDGYEVHMEHRRCEPLESGADIGYYEFVSPIDGSWTPTEVEMKAHFPLEVTLGDVATAHQSVLELLEVCLWSVRTVLQIFTPAFMHPRQPPLPVTAALAPGGQLPNPSGTQIAPGRYMEKHPQAAPGGQPPKGSRTPKT